MSSHQPLFIRFPQDLAHALGLFGLSGVEWECVLTVAHYTYGKGEDSAEIGMADFRRRSTKSVQGIRKALNKLVRELEVLEVVKDHTGTTGKVYRIHPPEAWAWGDRWARVRPLLSMYDLDLTPRSEPSVQAVRCALLLHEHCRKSIENAADGSVISADIPEPETQQRGFRAWCNYMERLLQRGVPESDIVDVIRFVHSNVFWKGRIQGQRAARILASNFDAILIQTRNPRQGTRR